MLDLKNITTDWTLFLDRDGVINVEKYQDYIYHYGEFVFHEGTKEALQYLSKGSSSLPTSGAWAEN
jgi:D-glycero-D-manno-heptose 1,7-bisphosphate phosphatase